MILAILVVLMAIVSVGLYLAPQMFSRVFNDEDEFQRHVDQTFRQMNVLPEAKNRVIMYDYGESAATAIRYDPMSDENMAVFRDQHIREIRSAFEERVKKSEAKRKKKEGDDFMYRPLQHVLLIDTALYESGTGARSLAIYTEEYEEKDQAMEKVDSSIDTWLLDLDDTKTLKTIQVFTAGYKEKAAVFSKEFFRKTYDKKKYKPGGEKYLEDDAGNYEKFVITPNNVTFFFDKDTVLKEKEGIVSVSMLRSYMGATVRSHVIKRYIDPNKPMVALTFDDGPGGKAERKILNCLKKYNAVATFFYLGNRVEGDAGTVKLAYTQGCEIGNHSWSHPEMTSLSKKDMKKQIKKTNKAIAGEIGVNPTLFRPPYGSTNDKVRKAANLPEILWSVDTLDWKLRDSKKIVKKVKKTKKLDGKIILMHSIYDETAEATEKLVPWLQKKGYQLVTVSELIRYKTGESPQVGESYGWED